MKRLFVVLIICLIGICDLHAQEKTFRICVVLTDTETSAVPHEIYQYAMRANKPAKKLLIDKNAIISSNDIENAFIIRAENRWKQFPDAYLTQDKDGLKKLKVDRKGWEETPEVKIILSEEGTKILDEFTRNNKGRELAVIWQGKVLMVLRIMVPVTAGKLGISSNEITTDEDAIKLVQELGFEPEFRYEE